MVTKRTVVPGQPGTKKWIEKFGNNLICVRYKYDTDKGKKIVTVELVVDEKDWQPDGQYIPKNKLFSIRIAYGEKELGQKVRAFGGKWNRKQKIWRVRWEVIQRLGLENRIVPEDFATSASRKYQPP